MRGRPEAADVLGADVDITDAGAGEQEVTTSARYTRTPEPVPDLDAHGHGDPVFVSWTVLRSTTPTSESPWVPSGASWWQSGHSSPGRARAPEPDGRWWSVFATWADRAPADAGPPAITDVTTWHVVLRPVTSHGDLVLAEGARPFDALGDHGPLYGVVALVTVAGAGADSGREREFFRRFLHVSGDIGSAPGHLVSLVHAPATDPEAGPVLTFSVWQDLEAALQWAYSRSRPHTAAVTRQRAHRLVERSGSLRCVVLSSHGSLGDSGDPLAQPLGAS